MLHEQVPNVYSLGIRVGTIFRPTPRVTQLANTKDGCRCQAHATTGFSTST